MEQVQETTVTPSRTIRLISETVPTLSVTYNVTEAGGNKRFLTFNSIENAVQAFNELRENLRPSYVTYSLFAKSQNELTTEMLRNHVLGLIPTANITYLRVDDNLHTGKVVVDNLEDYQNIKSSTNESYRFFHFDPKRVRGRRVRQVSTQQETIQQDTRQQRGQRRQEESVPRNNQRTSESRPQQNGARRSSGPPRSNTQKSQPQTQTRTQTQTRSQQQTRTQPSRRNNKSSV